MKAIRKILCAIDLGEASRSVIRCGLSLAEPFGARLFLFHAIHDPEDAIYSTTLFERGGGLEQAQAHAGTFIEDHMTRYAVPWTPMVVSGDPVERLCDFSAQQGMDLIVTASRGISGLKRVFLGTVVERMIRSVSCPVVVVKGNTDETHGWRRLSTKRPVKIIICCQRGRQKDPVSAPIFNLFTQWQGELILFHAMEAPVDETIVEPMEAPYAEIQEKLEATIAENLIAAVPSGVVNRFQITTRLVHGLAAETLPNLARELRADLVVVGVKKRGAVGKLLVGSTTEAVLRHAPCSVLTVPLPS